MKASIVLVVRNEEDYIDNCLNSVYAQSFRDWELVVIDDSSTDRTGAIVKARADSRTKYVFQDGRLGLGALRNRGVEESEGDYIFFTDGDCIPNKYWLAEGVSALDQSDDWFGVEGKTYYQTAYTNISHHIVESHAGEFMTCNVGYRRNIFEKLEFDPRFKYAHEDRELALRVLKSGSIGYWPNMEVIHQEKKRTIPGLFYAARRAEDMVLLQKMHGKQSSDVVRWKILYPLRLLVILFPPLLFLSRGIRSISDVVIALVQPVAYLYERLLIWKTAIRLQIFLL